MTTKLWDERLRVQLGGTWYHDAVDAERRTQSGDWSWQERIDKAYPDGSTYDNFGGYILTEVDPLRTDHGHILRLAGGYRLHGMSGHGPAAADLPEVDFSTIGHVFHAAAQYLYRNKATVAFTFSQGYRAPNLQEAVMLGDTGKLFHIPNNGLAPERANTFELLSRARLWRLQLGVTGYVSLLSDIIKREQAFWKGETEVGGKEVWQNVNGGTGRIWGTEAQLAADLVRRIVNRPPVFSAAQARTGNCS